MGTALRASVAGALVAMASAWMLASIGFDDNAFGRSCPPEKPCEDHCAPLKGLPDTAPGPFFGFFSGYM